MQPLCPPWFRVLYSVDYIEILKQVQHDVFRRYDFFSSLRVREE